MGLRSLIAPLSILERPGVRSSVILGIGLQNTCPQPSRFPLLKPILEQESVHMETNSIEIAAEAKTVERVSRLVEGTHSILRDMDLDIPTL